jgi:hypothetical protein
MRNLQFKTLQTVSYVQGTAAPIEMLRGVKTHRLNFRVTADITIVGAGGGAVQTEGIQRLLQRVRVLENGQPIADLSGRQLAYITSRSQYQAANVGALAGAGAQVNTIIRADLTLPFADPWGGDPSETCFIERDSRFPVTVEFTFAADANAALITGTGLTLNSLTVVTVQAYDPNSKVMPFFIPRYRRISSQSFTGAINQFPIFLYPEAGHRVSAVIAVALSDGSSVATMVTGNVTLRGDRVRYVDTVDFRTVLDEIRKRSTAIVPSAAYLDLDSRAYGKLSEMFISSQDDNFRLEVDGTGPGASNFFDVLMCEMAAIPGFTRDLPVGW